MGAVDRGGRLEDLGVEGEAREERADPLLPVLGEAGVALGPGGEELGLDVVGVDVDRQAQARQGLARVALLEVEGRKRDPGLGVGIAGDRPLQGQAAAVGVVLVGGHQEGVAGRGRVLGIGRGLGGLGLGEVLAVGAVEGEEVVEGLGGVPEVRGVPGVGLGPGEELVEDPLGGGRGHRVAPGPGLGGGLGRGHGGAVLLGLGARLGGGLRRRGAPVEVGLGIDDRDPPEAVAVGVGDPEVVAQHPLLLGDLEEHRVVAGVEDHRDRRLVEAGRVVAGVGVDRLAVDPDLGGPGGAQAQDRAQVLGGLEDHPDVERHLAARAHQGREVDVAEGEDLRQHPPAHRPILAGDRLRRVGALTGEGGLLRGQDLVVGGAVVVGERAHHQPCGHEPQAADPALGPGPPPPAPLDLGQAEPGVGADLPLGPAAQGRPAQDLGQPGQAGHLVDEAVEVDQVDHRLGVAEVGLEVLGEGLDPRVGPGRGLGGLRGGARGSGPQEAREGEEEDEGHLGTGAWGHSRNHAKRSAWITGGRGRSFPKWRD